MTDMVLVVLVAFAVALLAWNAGMWLSKMMTTRTRRGGYDGVARAKALNQSERMLCELCIDVSDEITSKTKEGLTDENISDVLYLAEIVIRMRKSISSNRNGGGK